MIRVMDSPSSTILALFSIILFSISLVSSDSHHENFLQCLSRHSQISTPISKVVYTPNNSSYSTILDSTIQNLRFLTPSAPKPHIIITPLNESHIQAAVICSKEHGLQIRTRSGGHDLEGLSYMSDVPFVIVDLTNFRSINVDIEDSSAWVQSGATIGDIYYGVSEKSNTLGFPAGVCPPVGVGGHFSGGGYGTLMRKYGLAADNIIDAILVNANGAILDRASMGEDMFWAIRGGGGASFGIIISWKIRLVYVPSVVTVFTVDKTLKQGATKLIQKWQTIAPNLHEDLFIRVLITAVNGSQEGEKTLKASFSSLFLGDIDTLLPLMNTSFPELGLQRNDCFEMSWVETTLYFMKFPTGTSLQVLKERNWQKYFFKYKSDYVKTPISEIGLEGIWRRHLENENLMLVLTPYGGIMDQISESEIPFPHRAGNLYKIQYVLNWIEGGNAESERNIEWIRRFYRYMTPHVSKSPRSTYVNYRDLDIGSNKGRNTSYSQAKIWGTKYFENNFKRLAQVKSQVDPDNFFWNEQSIPSFRSYA